MREPILPLLDELQRRLEDGFHRADQAAEFQPARRKRRRWKIAAGSAAGLSCAVLVATAFLGRGGEDHVFTVPQAVAAVSKAAFDAPQATSSKYLYTHTRQTGTMQGGFGTSSHHQFRFEFSYTTERDGWQSTRRASWTRSSLTSGTFPSQRDKAIAINALAAFDREEASIERALRRRHRRPSPLQIQDPYLPIRNAIDGKPPQSKAAVCRVDPGVSSFLFGPQQSVLPHIGSPPPTDAQQLYAQLVRQSKHFAGPDRRGAIWDEVQWSLRSGAPKLTPAQRAAMVEVIGLIPGVKTIGETADPNGNRAIGFVREFHGSRNTVYFDVDTSLVTYSDSVAVGPATLHPWHVPAGTILQRYELLDYRYVAAPPAGLAPTKPDGQSMLVGLCPVSVSRDHGHYLRTAILR